MWRKRKRISELRKELMLGRHTAPCCHCTRFFKTKELTLDHVVPKSQGGKLVRTNVILSCEPCNNERGDQDFIEFNAKKRAERGLPPIPRTEIPR